MNTTAETPYEILGVSEDIGFVQLRGIFRTKIHEHKQKKISVINFRKMCRAYETLSDRDKKARYTSHKEWISELSIDNYTPQQLAAEPDLIRYLKKRLEKNNLSKLNAQDPITGHTILYCAARAGNLEAVKFLTEYGAESDLQQRTKSTALHVASFYGHADVVRYLLESGADYRIINEGNNTAEAEAFNDEVKQVFTEMKQNDYVRVAANELDWFKTNGLKKHVDTEHFSQRQTLLHCASKKGHFDLVKWLVEKCSANINLIDSNDNTALHLAAYGGHMKIVEYLLNLGCDPALRSRWGTTAEEEGKHHGTKMTDLFKLMRERDMFEMARNGIDWWFYYYFDHPSKDSVDTEGISLLYYACRYGHLSVAKWLLEHGANVNIQMVKEPKSTPLHGAKFRGHVTIVELLLESGANVNIKNQHGATVFDEQVSKEVDETTERKINDLLQQYKSNLKNETLLDVHIYENDDNKEDPIAKLKLPLAATYKDLLSALAGFSGDEHRYFSIARRLLVFKNEQTTIISAVYSARYAPSKFIDTPIRLIRHKTLPTQYQSEQSIENKANLNLRQLTRDGKVTKIPLKFPLKDNKSVNIDKLTFTFSQGSITGDITFEVTALFSPNPETFGLSQCICLFRTELFHDTPKLLQLPAVSIVGEPNARLYTLVNKTTYWFTTHTRRTLLPMIGGVHAFIRHIDIIPCLLTLPPDMLLANSLDQPLKTRADPVHCTYVNIREKDLGMFPLIAYHGTNIKAIQSILYDGLVTPGTLVSCGKRIRIPENHIARDVLAYGLPNFAAAVFLSPSVHYSSYGAYAITFTHDNQQMIPVLECSVKKNSYKTVRCTAPEYKPSPGDDMSAIEWRVEDPRNVVINAVLFITKNASIDASVKERMTKTS